MPLHTTFHDHSLPLDDGTIHPSNQHDLSDPSLGPQTGQSTDTIVEGEGGQNPIDLIPIVLRPCPLPPVIASTFHHSVDMDGDDGGGAGGGGGGTEGVSSPAPAPEPAPAPPAPEPYGPSGQIGGMGNLDRHEADSSNTAEPQDPHLKWLRKRVLELGLN